MANNQAKNILIFSTAYFPLIGGAEIAVDEITKRLPNWQFDLITAKIQKGLKKEEKINNINIYRVGFGFSFDKYLLPFLGLIKAKKLEKKNNYNLIWSIMASQAGVAAVFFKIFSGKKLLLTLQEGDPEKHLRRYVAKIGFLYKIFIQPWHLMIFKQADSLTVISKYLKERALKNGVKVPIIIIPNGVDINKFKEARSEDLKENLNIKEDEKVILTVSRLVKKNGLEDLIKAGQYLDFSFKIVIVGDGPDRNELEKLVNKLNLGNEIIFEGNIDHNDLVKYYSSADIFVRPSFSEGQGISFLEAMAMKVPIIGTSVGGIVDFLVDRETGLFCQVNNPQSIAEKIKEVLADQSLRAKLVINARNLVEEKYSWNKIVFQMKGVFNKLL